MSYRNRIGRMTTSKDSSKSMSTKATLQIYGNVGLTSGSQVKSSASGAPPSLVLLLDSSITLRVISLLCASVVPLRNSRTNISAAVWVYQQSPSLVSKDEIVTYIRDTTYQVEKLSRGQRDQCLAINAFEPSGRIARCGIGPTGCAACLKAQVKLCLLAVQLRLARIPIDELHEGWFARTGFPRIQKCHDFAEATPQSLV